MEGSKPTRSAGSRSAVALLALTCARSQDDVVDGGCLVIGRLSSYDAGWLVEFQDSQCASASGVIARSNPVPDACLETVSPIGYGSVFGNPMMSCTTGARSLDPLIVRFGCLPHSINSTRVAGAVVRDKRAREYLARSESARVPAMHFLGAYE